MVLVAKLVVACGFNNFLVDSEFLMVVNLLKNVCPCSHNCYQLVKAIHDVSFECAILGCSHIYGKADQVADVLSEHGLTLMGSRIFEWVPDFLSVCVLANVISTSFPSGF